MRFFTVAIVAGLAALTASAPAGQSTSELGCSGTTVTALSTVTVHDGPPATVYLTVSPSGVDHYGGTSSTTTSHSVTSTRTTTVYLSAVPTSSTDEDEDLPTTTVTDYHTSTHTVTVPASQSYDETVTQTTVVSTVYQTLGSMPAQVTKTSTCYNCASATGPLSFVVVSGTTSWIGGVAPPSSISYVVVKTTVAVSIAPPVSLNHTRTTTLYSTVFGTKKTTITKTQPGSLMTPPATAGISWTQTAQGWNSSTWSGRSGFGTGYSIPTSSQTVFITEQSSYDLYSTRASESLTATSAKSGFAAYPVITSSTLTTFVSSTQSADGTFSSSKPSGYWNTSCSETVASYYGTGSVGTAYGTPTSSSTFWTTDSAIGIASSTTQSSSSHPSDVSTSSAIGEFSSSVSSSPPAYSYGPAPTSISYEDTTSSAIGIMTTLSTSSLTGASTVFSGNLSSSQTSTSCSSSVSAAPTFCGEIGDFTLNFNDFTPSIDASGTSITQSMHLSGPYHMFDFSAGYYHIASPNSPLVEFAPDHRNVKSINMGSDDYSGDISNADRGATGCFSFNFYGAALGCKSEGSICDFTISGGKYDLATKTIKQVAQETFSFPGCVDLLNCNLAPVDFTSEFIDVDVISINVMIDSEPTGDVWWMDDLKLGWFNNACSADLCRLSTPIH